MSKVNQYYLDQFAMSALSALIAKMPFFDIEGEYGKPVSKDELQHIKKTLTASAYEYAEWMMIAREDSKKWLEQNEDFFTKSK